jgi:TRAP-type C4-dicarboxylate transport system permease small subunit
MNRVLWWTGQVILVLISLFFLVFGISLFLGAYELDDPFSFIMTVFGSNLMILISAVLLIGFVLRMFNVYRLLKKKNGEEEESDAEAQGKRNSR